MAGIQIYQHLVKHLVYRPVYNQVCISYYHGRGYLNEMVIHMITLHKTREKNVNREKKTRILKYGRGTHIDKKLYLSFYLCYSTY